MSDAGVDRLGHLDYLRGLVSRPHLVDLLDALETGPMTAAQLGAVLPRRRRSLSRALRELMISGLVTGDMPGTRDGVAPTNERYQYTDRGRVILGLLSKFSVWNSLYDEQDAVSRSAP